MMKRGLLPLLRKALTRLLLRAVAALEEPGGEPPAEPMLSFDAGPPAEWSQRMRGRAFVQDAGAPSRSPAADAEQREGVREKPRATPLIARLPDRDSLSSPAAQTGRDVLSDDRSRSLAVRAAGDRPARSTGAAERANREPRPRVGERVAAMLHPLVVPKLPAVEIAERAPRLAPGRTSPSVVRPEAMDRERVTAASPKSEGLTPEPQNKGLTPQQNEGLTPVTKPLTPVTKPQNEGLTPVKNEGLTPEAKKVNEAKNEGLTPVVLHWPSLEASRPARRVSPADFAPPVDLSDRWPELPELPPWAEPEPVLGDHLRRLDDEQRGRAWSE
jgi:hypothetical protein